MMSFCKTRVHSFLGRSYFNNTTTDNPILPPLHDDGGGGGGLSFITATAGKDTRRHPTTVLESTTVKFPAPPPTRRPGGRIVGFVEDDAVSGGLNSCTETLGFESSDETHLDGSDESPATTAAERRPEHRGRKEERLRNYPPPLSSMTGNGRPSFILRPVRTDGRLELTEVRISRPEILRASREDGRLRLHLIPQVEDEEEEDEEDTISETQYHSQEEEEGIICRNEESKEETVRKEGESGAAACVFRRCNDSASGEGHGGGRREVHVWRQHCVV